MKEACNMYRLGHTALVVHSEALHKYCIGRHHASCRMHATAATATTCACALVQFARVLAWFARPRTQTIGMRTLACFVASVRSHDTHSLPRQLVAAHLRPILTALAMSAVCPSLNRQIFLWQYYRLNLLGCCCIDLWQCRKQLCVSNEFKKGQTQIIIPKSVFDVACNNHFSALSNLACAEFCCLSVSPRKQVLCELQLRRISLIQRL